MLNWNKMVICSVLDCCFLGIFLLLSADGEIHVFSQR